MLEVYRGDRRTESQLRDLERLFVTDGGGVPLVSSQRVGELRDWLGRAMGIGPSRIVLDPPFAPCDVPSPGILLHDRLAVAIRLSGDATVNLLLPIGENELRIGCVADGLNMLEDGRSMPVLKARRFPEGNFDKVIKRLVEVPTAPSVRIAGLALAEDGSRFHIVLRDAASSPTEWFSELGERQRDGLYEWKREPCFYYERQTRFAFARDAACEHDLAYYEARAQPSIIHVRGTDDRLHPLYRVRLSPVSLTGHVVEMAE